MQSTEASRRNSIQKIRPKSLPPYPRETYCEKGVSTIFSLRVFSCSDRNCLGYFCRPLSDCSRIERCGRRFQQQGMAVKLYLAKAEYPKQISGHARLTSWLSADQNSEKSRLALSEIARKTAGQAHSQHPLQFREANTALMNSLDFARSPQIAPSAARRLRMYQDSRAAGQYSTLWCPG